MRSRLLIMTAALGAHAAVLFAQPLPAQREEPARVVIVPFYNLTGMAADAWIGSGIAESLRFALQLDGFVVAMDTQADDGDPSADLIVTGVYQRIADQISITARMTEIRTGDVLRSATVDGPLEELFGLQDQIADTLLVDSTRADPEPGLLAGAGTVEGMIDGPPPPVAPEVMTRAPDGRVTVRALKLDEPLTLDGQLDESIYQAERPITGLIQQVPNEGNLATEKTDAWIMFDEDSVYFAARVWESAPRSEWVANEMRRDSRALFRNDTFGMSFDTFYDRRNGFFFYTNPLGGMTDQRVRPDGPNIDWNTVWDAQTGRFEGGWTLEVEIPFKSLRYRSGPNQVWGVQFRRVIMRKNELVHLTPLPGPYQDVLDFAYYSGWRKREILGLQWDEVDEAGGVVRLSPARSKTRVGRVLPISAPIAAVLSRRRARRRPGEPRVFTCDQTTVRAWRRAWPAACRQAGVPGRLLHDCRRTAARNLVRAGVPERVAMVLTGHKTRAIFDRYCIVNEADLHQAGAQLVAYLDGAREGEDAAR